MKSILMRGELVLLAMAGLKTQTRRAISPQPGAGWELKSTDLQPDGTFLFCSRAHLPFDCPGCERVKPAYLPGECVVVKETHWRFGRWVKAWVRPRRLRDGSWTEARQGWQFRGDRQHDQAMFGPPASRPARTALGWHARPSLFMPHAHSRLTVKVTAVRAQRLGAVTDADAAAEGITESPASGMFAWKEARSTNPDGSEVTSRQVCATPRAAFMHLWDDINAARGLGCDRDPWVFAYTFQPHGA